MRIRGLSSATLVQFSERQDLGQVQRLPRELLLRHDRDPLQGHVRRSDHHVNWVRGYERQKTNGSVVIFRDYSCVRAGTWSAIPNLDKAAKQQTAIAMPRQAQSGAGKTHFHRGTISAAVAVDANTGTLVGDYGTIVRTTDGGNNWTIQSSGVDANFVGRFVYRFK